MHRAEIRSWIGQHDRAEADQDRSLGSGAGPVIALDYAVDALARNKSFRSHNLVYDSASALLSGPADTNAAGFGIAALLFAEFRDQLGGEWLAHRVLDRHGVLATFNQLQLAETFVSLPLPKDVAVKLAAQFEAALPKLPKKQRDWLIAGQVAFNYRAGRPAEHIVRILEETSGRSNSRRCIVLLFLAMSQQTLGHNAEARRLLTQFDELLATPTFHPDFWERIRLSAIRREVHAKIYLDPVFPPWPFAGP